MNDFHIPPDLVIGPSADLLPLAGEVNWGMEKLGLAALRDISDGAGVVVGVVDTGVDATHPLLTNLKAAKDFTGSRYGAADRNGHGTHVTGTAGGTDPRIGVASGARSVHGKGLSDGGSGTGSMIVGAMEWCAAEGAEVVSMSLGSSGEDRSITACMRRLADKGIWVVAAAGNSGGGTPDVDWPGRSEHCISVAALDSNLAPASFTNRGAKIDTAGPGVFIWSAKPGGGYQQMSGTSMATPWVAGFLTCLRSALKLRGLPVPTVYELRKLLADRSRDVFQPGDDLRTGPGFPSALLFALGLTPDPPRVA